MKYLLLCAALFALCLMPTLAWANCSSHYITLPDGRSVVCQTCCQPTGSCQTVCS